MNPPTYHRCNFPQCEQAVETSEWGCAAHLRLLPFHLRRDVVVAYLLQDNEGRRAAIDFATAEVKAWLEAKKDQLSIR